jgi:uncharacterized membrane protein YphA (DoxX/SURF4 family)
VGSPGFDERVLTMPRVPSDPAQVIVNHASFRVQLGATSARALGLDDRARHLPVAPPAPRSAAVVETSGYPGYPGSPSGTSGSSGRRRLAPVVWSGHTAPGDASPGSGAGSPIGELLQAVRDAGAGAATQLLPRIDETTVLPPAAPSVLPTVIGQRSAGEPTGQLGGMRPVHGAYDPADDDVPPVAYVGSDGGGGGIGGGGDEPETGPRRNRRGEQVRHAWYPHRRMNLGIVLLPLRIFLGFVCIYAGMGKLCDRVYFDGGERGSMVTWLSSLHPWGLAEPLRDSALNHPVGAGLSIAFLQVVVGVLTVFGLWQRVAAAFGAALSIALLVTVSWRTVPVYDAPDFIYLAAWSPLVIAGAPVYSIDGHLAGDAWRRLGPRVGVWDLRRRVLRRGTVMAALIIGAALLVGSVLGAAVRATTGPRYDRPGDPAVIPTNNLPGSPLPTEPSPGDPSPQPTHSAQATREARGEAITPAPTTAPGRAETTNGTGPLAGTGTYPTSGGSGTRTGSGSGPDRTSQAPKTPAAPATEAPVPAQPSDKPSEGGALGGLLGSHSPTGLLLGMPSGGASGVAEGSA